MWQNDVNPVIYVNISKITEVSNETLRCVFRHIIAETHQQISEVSQAIADAQRDAKLADTQVWAASGCVFGVIGILLAYVYTPQVPAVKLLGKSPEYVAYYTSTYQQIVVPTLIRAKIS